MIFNHFRTWLVIRQLPPQQVLAHKRAHAQGPAVAEIRLAGPAPLPLHPTPFRTCRRFGAHGGEHGAALPQGGAGDWRRDQLPARELAVAAKHQRVAGHGGRSGGSAEGCRKWGWGGPRQLLQLRVAAVIELNRE